MSWRRLNCSIPCCPPGGGSGSGIETVTIPAGYCGCVDPVEVPKTLRVALPIKRWVSGNNPPCGDFEVLIIPIYLQEPGGPLQWRWLSADPDVEPGCPLIKGHRVDQACWFSSQGIPRIRPTYYQAGIVLGGVNCEFGAVMIGIKNEPNFPCDFDLAQISGCPLTTNCLNGQDFMAWPGNTNEFGDCFDYGLLGIQNGGVAIAP